MENCCITASGDCIRREALCQNGTRILLWQAEYPSAWETSDVGAGLLDDFRRVCREGLYAAALEVYRADSSPRKRYRFVPFDCRMKVADDVLSVSVRFTENNVPKEITRSFRLCKGFGEGEMSI